MSDVIVRLESVSKDFRPGLGLRRKRVLFDVSLEVRQGEIFGFLGPNGAGKTTTLKLLMGLIHPTEGRAEILGHDVRETAFRRHIGYVPENPWFYEYLTAREFLRFYARLCERDGTETTNRIEELLDYVGLGHAADQRLRTFSKGMLQRAGLAQALVNDPKVVFLDEPMSGLDPVGRVEIRDLIQRLRLEGRTVFMNTHILSDVEFLCDRVGIIAGGRIRHLGPAVDFESDEALSDVVLVGLPADLSAALVEKFEARVSGDGARVEVRLATKEVPPLLRASMDAGAEVRAVTPCSSSLERRFLAAVEEARS